jgi:hypothetical protein
MVISFGSNATEYEGSPSQGLSGARRGKKVVIKP